MKNDNFEIDCLENFDLNLRNCCYWPCCPSENRCSCKSRCCSDGKQTKCKCCKDHCRKDLCEDDFRIRLAGLTEGLNYRLYQQLWFHVKLVLENGHSVFGKIIYVGSNFVELLLPLVDGDRKEELEKKKVTVGGIEGREHRKGRTLIIPIDRIVMVETSSEA